MNSEDKIEIQLYIHQIKTGKPCAYTNIKNDYLEEAIAFIESEGLFTYVEENLYGWSVLYFFKHKKMEEIIKHPHIPKVPKSDFDHWILGNLFGFSHESIMEFIGE